MNVALTLVPGEEFKPAGTAMNSLNLLHKLRTYAPILKIRVYKEFSDKTHVFFHKRPNRAYDVTACNGFQDKMVRKFVLYILQRLGQGLNLVIIVNFCFALVGLFLECKY